VQSYLKFNPILSATLWTSHAAMQLWVCMCICMCVGRDAFAFGPFVHTHTYRHTHTHSALRMAARQGRVSLRMEYSPMVREGRTSAASQKVYPSIGDVVRFQGKWRGEYCFGQVATHTHIRMYRHTHMHAHTYVCTDIHTCTHTHPSMHTCIRTHTSAGPFTAASAGDKQLDGRRSTDESS
jgi:hypothetical protein